MIQFAFAASAAALALQAAPEPQPAADQPIVITGQKDTEKTVQDFVRALTPVESHGQLSRFEHEVCPKVFGIPDPEFGAKKPCTAFQPPAERLGPHVATLGMRFYTGTQFPEQYRGQIFIAEHGSWNRSSKIGYRVTLVRLDASRKPVSYESFAEGWLQGQSAWGRPSDVQVAPDGSLLVSDDGAGVVWRLTYGLTPPASSASRSTARRPSHRF